MPLTEAMGRQIPRTPATRPRWTTGTWSGSTAMREASNALKNTWAMHHPTRTAPMLGANATTRIPTEPPSSPTTIHGRRMPSLEEVRSLILPKNGLAIMARNAPVPATRDRLLGARSVPTSALTFNDKLTNSGARNSRMVPMYASEYNATKPQRTGRWRAIVVGSSVGDSTGPTTSGSPASRREVSDIAFLRPDFCEDRRPLPGLVARRLLRRALAGSGAPDQYARPQLTTHKMPQAKPGV